MAEILDDPPEFTDDELRAALRDMGEEARKAAFAIGRPIMIVEDGQLFLLYSDGSKQLVRRQNLEAPNGKEP